MRFIPLVTILFTSSILAAPAPAPNPDILKDIFSGFGKNGDKASSSSASNADAATASARVIASPDAAASASAGASPNMNGGGGSSSSSSGNNTISLASLLDLGSCNPLGCAKEITDIVGSCAGAIIGHGINVGADLSCVANSIKVGIPTPNNDCTTCLIDALKKVFAVMGKIKEDIEET
ncbi:hypothetical protein BDV29DRAFT_155106 [Aspergillus leporis]|uniref:Uncharacterized protein n=1 Tax=Aspergillus leporis TaxID=41062 RepID=A0A5N5X7H6_9EURO|nr:hypothetical protein BDV29DRAFT_155106 [Aspergillus leporis]